MLCPYQDSLGVPGKGFHTHFMGVAILDILGTILLSETLVFLLGTDRMITFLCVFLTGIVLHRVFCVRTTIDKYLFP
jgi:hypothetical protein